MTQGEFTKEEAQATIEAVKELSEAIPKTKIVNYIGHLNDIYLFLEEAKRKAPLKAEKK